MYQSVMLEDADGILVRSAATARTGIWQEPELADCAEQEPV